LGSSAKKELTSVVKKKLAPVVKKELAHAVKKEKYLKKKESTFVPTIDTAIQFMLCKLLQSQSSAVLLRYNGQTTEQVAAVLKMTESDVMWGISCARRVLCFAGFEREATKLCGSRRPARKVAQFICDMPSESAVIPLVNNWPTGLAS
jgi:hypothetical protein